MKVIFNKIEVKSNRSILRKNMPLAEQLIWHKLRNKQLLGYKFRRQYSIHDFIVDFYCPKIKLAIEIDGESHFDSVQSKKIDMNRQKSIESVGIKIIRFTNHDIYNNLDGVLQEIIKNLP